MIGEHGVQVTSRTLLQSGHLRVDVENPAPGVRPGQLHLQDEAGHKFLYNFDTDRFEGLPRPLVARIANDPSVVRAVATGKRYLGIDGGSWQPDQDAPSACA